MTAPILNRAATQPPAKPSALVTIAHAMERVACRILRADAFRELDERRLRAIEDRLAKLDGGADAAASQRSALFDVVGEHIADGKRPPDLVLDGDRVRWSGAK